MVFDRTGRVLFAGRWGGDHAAWDLATRRTVWVAETPVGCTISALSPDGRTLALGCSDGSIFLYDLPVPVAIRVKETAGLPGAWEDLASADAAVGWRARRRLVAVPGEAVALLRERLKPLAKGSKEVTELDSEDYETRQSSARKIAAALRRADKGAEYALRDLLRSKPSLEAYRRAERLLDQAGAVPFGAEDLRTVRAVAVLEQVDF